ncbi:hypothetical protein QPK31_18505 [Massilia sp. YIM B02769]|uniref:hypothetical protein n=1 Tax=Massilia sp. YIM B02769 TaxID=3050129 RepID=UPI0025B6BE2E|nr:hypothetical protein [Massilia sp. YIM B02769]MDN4060201.1 hypothetical protein [Massilia sp. YIM B02769]
MRKISTRQQYWAYVAALPLMYLMGILALEISPAFLLPLFALLLVGGIGGMSLACTHCGARLLYREKQVAGTPIYYWSWKLPKKCPRCDVPV